ncbi:sulfite exporter TauE/SafE family protein [Propioniciclava soli]|uniref:Probable membrane transporter protein n=1 Tax=Propioniciclava soli TaxID=2775081 RepID=A0ABZ3C8G5_9ACTN
MEVVAAVLALAFIGAVVQGVLGFGLGVVAAPFVAWLAPEVLPAALVLASLPLPLLTLGGEWRATDWRALGWALVGRLPATLVGVFIVAVVPVAGLQILVAASVLLMVGLTLFRVEVPRTGVTLAGAGVLSGITGTTTGIGGPPIAIVLRNDEPAVARATMAAYFMIGSLLTLGALASVGRVSGVPLAAGLAMLPASVLGFVVALGVRRHVTGARFRGAVLAVSSIAAVALLVRALSG